jgi:ABC-type antimicrobial peptide transport system ATPase subunit
MPKKKHTLSEEERRKRIRETAREIGTSNDPKEFERAFKKVASSKKPRAD